MDKKLTKKEIISQIQSVVKELGITLNEEEELGCLSTSEYCTAIGLYLLNEAGINAFIAHDGDYYHIDDNCYFDNKHPCMEFCNYNLYIEVSNIAVKNVSVEDVNSIAKCIFEILFTSLLNSRFKNMNNSIETIKEILKKSEFEFEREVSTEDNNKEDVYSDAVLVSENNVIDTTVDDSELPW